MALACYASIPKSAAAKPLIPTRRLSRRIPVQPVRATAITSPDDVPDLERRRTMNLILAGLYHSNHLNLPSQWVHS